MRTSFFPPAYSSSIESATSQTYQPFVMKSSLLLLLFACLLSSAFGQHVSRPKYVITTFTNAQTAKPFGSFQDLFTGEVHPGLELAAGMNWTTKEKHDWFQEIRFGYFWHRWVQHSFSLYTEFGYRYKLPARFELEARLGGGYARVIVANEVFADGYDKNKQYTKITSGRNQAILTTSFAASKSFSKHNETKVFFQYQQRIQTPFVQSYIPLLPYNIAMLGLRIPLHSKTLKN